jgi:hypothetical protein
VGLFIRLCLQNHSELPKSKRESTFRALRHDEIDRLERCLREDLPEGYRSAGIGRAAVLWFEQPKRSVANPCLRLRGRVV